MTTRPPYVQPAAEGTYWVSGPLRTETVGPVGTAQEAIAMVVELPATGLRSCLGQMPG
ncbi:DUF6193 family natural product biosynthesis protein [Streptomyces sp. NPDC052396]|uniref:DUF6193 family natural product biosynthesis protein n=1 Tax=Streptomyces sp. NPDC052396 TaxID=3365689 RepID=UPI0037CFF542